MRSVDLNKAAVRRAIEILDTATRMRWLNWLVCPAGGRSPVGRNDAPVRARLAGLCCHGGILRVQGDEVVVAFKSCFESEDR